MVSIFSANDYNYLMSTVGYCHFREVIPVELVKKLRVAIDRSIADEQAAGLSSGNYAYLAHIRDKSFEDLLELSPLQNYIDVTLSDTCILHSYNLISLNPQVDNPIQNAIHRDTPRFCRPYLLSVQILYLIDDFTVKNGATEILPGSHQLDTKPSEEFFEKNKVCLTGRAGDAFIFDSLVWHRGGSNSTAENRRGITKVFTRSFMKQQIDMIAVTPEELLNSLSGRSRRLLGYNVRVPKSLVEFRQPPQYRTYLANQG